jgi:large subunit ribosomal protein L7/L12
MGQMGGGGGGGAPAGGAAATEAEPVVEAAPVEKTHYDVELSAFDAATKIKLIKEVRALLGLGLKEAKETVESCPTWI